MISDLRVPSFLRLCRTNSSVQWRYTVWLHWDGKNLVGDFSKPLIGEELYAHATDDGTGAAGFDLFENENVAAKNPDVTKQLLTLAKQHWSKSGAEMQVEVAASATAAGKSGEGQPQLLDERLQFEEWWK